jgi:hypothetical protein
VPKQPGPWKDDRPAFGVEFKLADEYSFDTRRFTRWAAQAVDYAETEWDDFGRLMIFGCPSPLRRIASSAWGPGAAGLMARLLGQMGVGELAPMEGDGLALILHGQHRLWSQRRGVLDARRWSMQPRSGSR